MPSGKGSWYSQFNGKYCWRDTGDAPNSNALGVPDSEQGISLPSRDGLGKWFKVTAPNGVTLIERQTELGPGKRTGRGIDISAAAAERFGYSPSNFPTDGIFKWEPAPMPTTSEKVTDAQRIPHIVDLAKSSLQAIQHTAARKLMNFDGEVYPADGCAITQSCLLQAAGIAIPDTYQAIVFGNMLEKRGWKRIPVGQQQAGDIGSTCGSSPHHGVDHVYLVIAPVNSDEMVIADNQQPQPHFRWASGKGGKSPTTHFLRAP